MLHCAEELLLFLLDEQSGTLLPVTPRTERLALAGAVLMELQLRDRIDTDLDTLMLTDPTPLGDDLLDPTLADIAAAEEEHDAVYWLERSAARGREIRGRAIAKLVGRGILLEPDDDGFLSLAPEVAHARRYPSTNGTTQEHVRLRVMRVLFSDDIPDPADIVIITLIDACAVWRKVLSVEELAKARRADPPRQPPGSDRTGGGRARTGREADGWRRSGRRGRPADCPRPAAGDGAVALARPEDVLPTSSTGAWGLSSESGRWGATSSSWPGGRPTCSCPARSACICTRPTCGIRCARRWAPPASY